jgi:carbamoyltransferase
VWILGVSSFRDDATAALLHDGAVVGIAEEERFLRVKHAVHNPLGPFITSLGETAPLPDFELRYFPQRAVDFLLAEAGIDSNDIDVVAYDFDFEHRIAQWPRFQPLFDLLSPADRDRMSETWRYWLRWLREFADNCGARLELVPHHLAHAGGTVFGSGLSETAFVVMDALGELESTTLGHFDGAFHIRRRVPLPHSLGLLYAAVTRYLGFRPFSDEQKTMGLAAYGDPAVFRKAMESIVWPAPEGFLTDPSVIWTSDIKMDADRPPALAGIVGSLPRPATTDASCDPYPHVAAAAQEALERVLHHLVDDVLAGSGSRSLAMAGGVALNCAANGTLLGRTDLDTLYIQPQAGDSGTALGAAYVVHHRLTGGRPEPLPHAYWGPGFAAPKVAALLDRLKLPYQRVSEPWETAAEMLARGEVIGWFQGRAECGPRALGNRSILAHPADPATRDRINVVVKDRETWRPFAASILDERRARYLAVDTPSPFMLLTVPLTGRGRTELAAAAHIDATTRPQTVSASVNPRYHRLIRSFEQRTGIGAVLNTSLNVKGEPIANEPMDAVRILYTTAMDALIIEDCVVRKHPEPAGGDTG